MPLDLTNPEIKAAVDEAIAEATRGLQAKNAELIRKLKAAGEVKPEDYQRALEERDNAVAKLTELEQSAKTMKASLKQVSEALDAERNDRNKADIEATLTSALVAAKVRPEVLEVVKEFHRSRAAIATEGQQRKIMLGDKPVADAIAEWASSETGKHFIAAPQSAGGGANGGGNSGPSGRMTKKPERADFGTDEPAYWRAAARWQDEQAAS